MRNGHRFILENNGIEALRLFRDWERHQYKECNYKIIGSLHLDVYIVIWFQLALN